MNRDVAALLCSLTVICRLFQGPSGSSWDRRVSDFARAIEPEEKNDLNDGSCNVAPGLSAQFRFLAGDLTYARYKPKTLRGVMMTRSNASRVP